MQVLSSKLADMCGQILSKPRLAGFYFLRFLLLLLIFFFDLTNEA